MHNDIKQAKETLIKGGIICYPTDTIWGIGCDATNPEAVEKLYQIKQRDDSKSMLVILDDIGKIASYVEDMPDIAYDLLEVSTEPLTIIFSEAKNLAPNLIATDGSIGIRVIEHPWCKKLLQQFKKPIVSTSANFSKAMPSESFHQIDQKLLEKCDYVAEYERDATIGNKPSSIIKLGNSGQVEIIRK